MLQIVIPEWSMSSSDDKEVVELRIKCIGGPDARIILSTNIKGIDTFQFKIERKDWEPIRDFIDSQIYN